MLLKKSGGMDGNLEVGGIMLLLWDCEKQIVWNKQYNTNKTDQTPMLNKPYMTE
jgi:hypothetical protein